jgi:hypothetical protein
MVGIGGVKADTCPDRHQALHSALQRLCSPPTMGKTYDGFLDGNTEHDMMYVTYGIIIL